MLSSGRKGELRASPSCEPTVAVTKMKYGLHTLLPASCSNALRVTISADVPRAAKLFQTTFAGDPMFRYIRNNREITRAQKTMELFAVSTYVASMIETHVALTINAGVANVTARPPKDPDYPKLDPVAMLLEWLMKVQTKIHKRMIRDPEAKKRQLELDDKMQKALERALGDCADKMWLLEGIWTAAEYQGRGYGGALLDAVTKLADAAGQRTWLKSSNIVNTAFYNEHGFKTVEEVVLGDQNPTWHEKPVIVNIMVREPRYLDCKAAGAVPDTSLV
ncbi:hypothetical protein FPV67DRAFT_1669273 [Lyophyllum atratum]|nr:hypothetical protein FPV67DRAFT_1669273 [Lyophyllum atratum]